MAWIEEIPPEEAEGETARAYRQVAGSRGRVAHILRVQGLNPRALTAHLRLYRTLMFGPSPLSRAQRERLAVVVSSLNGCHY